MARNKAPHAKLLGMSKARGSPSPVANSWLMGCPRTVPQRFFEAWFVDILGTTGGFSTVPSGMKPVYH